MKTLLHTPITHMIRNTLLSLFLVVASAAYGDVPSMKVIVFDANGRVAFKGAMNANATFATGNLQPGNYVVQFNSKSAAVKGNQYLLVVSSGKKKVTATDIPGEMFADAGVAMKVNVGRELKIIGQVATVRVANGKRYVWVVAETGSHLGGHWAEEGVSGAQHIVRMKSGFLQRMQDYSGEGSMLNRFHDTAYEGD